MSRLAALSLIGALLVVLAAPRLQAQPSPAPRAPSSAEPAAPPSSAPLEAPPAQPSSSSATPPAPAEPATTPSPSPAAEPAAPAPRAPVPSLASVGPARGAIVVALSAEARPAARSLARGVYRDAKLRPAMSEAVAQVLLGGEPTDPGDFQQTEARDVVASLEAVQDDGVRRRLLASLGSDLGARMVVLVDQPAGGPRARVLRLPEGKLLGLTLAAEAKRLDDGRQSWDWRDALGILRGLVGGPPPGPRAAAPRPASPAAVAEEGEDDWALLKSPWFWGTLGVVVTVGVTVLVLSQTALNEPDVVMVEGRVGR